MRSATGPVAGGRPTLPAKRSGRLRPEFDDLGADEARAQHRDADAARRQFEPQALRQRDHAVLGDVVGDAAAGDQAGDRGGRDDVPALAVPLDQRAEISMPQTTARRFTPSVQSHAASLHMP